MAEGRTEMVARIGWGQTSAQMALLANVNRDPKKGRPFTPDDFNPFSQGKTRKSKGIPLTADTLRSAKGMFMRDAKRRKQA